MAPGQRRTSTVPAHAGVVDPDALTAMSRQTCLAPPPPAPPSHWFVLRINLVSMATSPSTDDTGNLLPNSPQYGVHERGASHVAPIALQRSGSPHTVPCHRPASGRAMPQTHLPLRAIAGWAGPAIAARPSTTTEPSTFRDAAIHAGSCCSLLAACSAARS